MKETPRKISKIFTVSHLMDPKPVFETKQVYQSQLASYGAGSRFSGARQESTRMTIAGIVNANKFRLAQTRFLVHRGGNAGDRVFSDHIGGWVNTNSSSLRMASLEISASRSGSRFAFTGGKLRSRVALSSVKVLTS
ncbi:unnamed protein product [Dovyalis caffra]|uniref:Uncharacterized protein n=1 Tax=Dovyalis caffra TaxID=77055 RepID=A0AAV1SBQ2_9ROSI|nr:unnamed protein product [Dovyalis caffra]